MNPKVQSLWAKVAICTPIIVFLFSLNLSLKTQKMESSISSTITEMEPIQSRESENQPKQPTKKRPKSLFLINLDVQKHKKQMAFDYQN